MASEKNSPVTIDGAMGEGGGQVLRTSLAMALIHRRPLCVRSIRAGRKRPGLLRQHLTALRAAATIGDAVVEGDELNSTEILFTPKALRHGDYTFKIGSAGSTSLVLQTVLWPLLCAEGRSRLRLEGGTHAAMAPPFDFLDEVLLPILRRMGALIEARLIRHGFYPAGGGIVEIEIEGGHELRPLQLVERAAITHRRATVYISRLPRSVAERVLRGVAKGLGWSAEELIITEVDSPGPGCTLTLATWSPSLCEMSSSFGSVGVRAEVVARAAVDGVRTYLASGAPVGRHLADQLLIPMALAGDSKILTSRPTPHTHTNAAVIAAFVGAAPVITRHEGGRATIEVSR
ncbi:MAG TPA: RNA 3'-terminal phosphate cyclase [Nannocystis exedens]|nr:RNA 3'-terminal phosphate cyclase [Nannocystis exedens]